MTDPQGLQFVMRAMQCMFHLNHVSVEANENMMLIDGRTNQGMATSGMHLLETPVMRVNADIVGVADEVNISGLSIGKKIYVWTTSNGECVVTICPQLVGYIKSKSMFSVSQIETYGLDIHYRSHTRGGDQKVVNCYAYVFKS
jgi:hypothetical protein